MVHLTLDEDWLERFQELILKRIDEKLDAVNAELVEELTRHVGDAIKPHLEFIQSTADFMHTYLEISFKQVESIHEAIERGEAALARTLESKGPIDPRDVSHPLLDTAGAVEGGSSSLDPVKRAESSSSIKGETKMSRSHWRYPLAAYGDDDLRVVAFVSREHLKQAVFMLWEDSDLKGCPYHSDDGDTLIIPMEAVAIFKARGLEIDSVKPRINLGHYPLEVVAEARRRS